MLTPRPVREINKTLPHQIRSGSYHFTDFKRELKALKSVSHYLPRPDAHRRGAVFYFLLFDIIF